MRPGDDAIENGKRVQKMVQTIDVLVLSGNSVADNRLVNIFFANLICLFLADVKPIYRPLRVCAVCALGLLLLFALGIFSERIFDPIVCVRVSE